MSRPAVYAAALAYRLPELEQAPRRTVRPPYKLLGGSGGITGITGIRSMRTPRTPRPPSAPPRAYLELFTEPSYAPHYRGPRASAPEPASHLQVRVAHPQWLMGTLVCMVALLAVGPVLASGRGTNRPDFGVLRPPQAPAGARSQVPGLPTQPQAAAPGKAPKPAPARPTRTYELLGPPSLSVGAIESVLRQYGSEAAGTGQAMYDLGLRYGIDPAYALAFFVHESACGTRGIARFTHSIGNIRWTSGYDNYQGYRSYATWEQGMEDWYKLITDLYINGWGLRTVDTIVPVYAPYGDNNDPPSYIADVQSLVDAWRGK